MIIAGEASGDMYGARLVEEAHRLDSSVRFFGIGGQAMRSAGVETMVDSRDMAVMGFVEVVAHFGVIYRAFRLMESLLNQRKPDLLILIDYPGFNLRLAARAKKAGVKVLYYITPQVWAWHRNRAKKIARLVDHAAVILPFEVPIFEKEGGTATFVGHPLLDMAVPSMSRETAQQQFGLTVDRRTIGLFPGSRRREIKALLPIMLESAATLKGRFPDLQFILPLATGLDRGLVDACLSASPVDVTVVEGKSYDVIQVCDLIIAASGTVTMEIALFGVPMVIVYKVAPLTYAIGKRLVQVDHVGICNIIAGERVVPELIQDEAEPGRIVAEVEGMLVDGGCYAEVREKLLGVRARLGEPGAPGRVAAIAMQLIGRN